MQGGTLTKDNVRTSIGEITLTTYPLLGENRNPVFHSQYGVAHIYPYTLQDEIATQPEEKVYRTLNLENKYLRVTVLSDLGGRVYSLYDKIAEREVFYKNPTIKFSPLAIRGAFFSGGLEFSFPVAHAPTTADPVNWDIMQEDDGSASIMIGGLEHMSGMRWTIKLTLYPNRCALSQDVWLHNPTPIPGRYHYWTNASLDSDEKTEFIYPLQRVRSYEFEGTSSWPVARLDLIKGEPGLPGMEGVPMWPAERLHQPLNLRWEKDMLAQISIFGRDVTWDFFGAWQHASNTGYAHFARYKDVSGMKLWSWGKSEVGIVNQSALMDDGALYAETQCGAMETQLDFDFLPPGKTKQWREWWLPLRNLGGLTCASENVGARINMTPGDDESQISLTVGICPVYKIENAALELAIPDKVLLAENHLVASPENPWITTIPIEARVLAAHPITLKVLDSENQEILSYTHKRNALPVSSHEVVDDLSPSTSEDYYQLGLKHENFDNRAQAMASYHQAILHDKDHNQSHYQLGVMLLRNADYKDARDHMKQAADQGNKDAIYFLGLISWYENDIDKALQYFQSVPDENTFAMPALRGQVTAAFYQQRWEDAVHLLQNTKPTKEYASPHSLLLAIAYHRLDQLENSAQELKKILGSDPLNLVALRELSLIEKGTQPNHVSKLQRLLSDDPQYILDLAGFYLDSGLFLDALVIFETFGIEWGNPMLSYLAALICQILGQPDSAEKWRSKAQEGKPDKVFPSRLWEVNALINALEQNSKDQKAKYYLGNFYYAHQRFDEAMQLWHEAQKSLADNDVLYRNLGLAYWQQEEDLGRATEAFEKAVTLNPNNQDLYIHLDDLYKIQGKNDKRENILKAIQKLDPIREDVRKRIISILIDLGRPKEALKILTEEKFVPLEMDQSFHLLYVRALVQRAETQIQTGNIDAAVIDLQQALNFPENHGVGRPTTMGNAEIYYSLGCAYEMIGEYKLALQAWKEGASEHHPFGDHLFEYVQKSLDKLGRYSELGYDA